MSSDQRNFRSIYYEKVGCHSVEEKKSLNKLLQDNIRNPEKLKQFCLSYPIPAAHRVLLWSIIFGIHPLHKSSTDYVLEQRQTVYDDLFKAVNVMQYVDATTAKSHVFETMWLLENNRLMRISNKKDEDDLNFGAVVRVLLQILDSNNDMETYWIAKAFFLCMLDIKKECPKLIELTQSLLMEADGNLYQHFIKLKVFQGKELSKWYSTCFANIISESALVKVWDKICGGSIKIVIFIFLELVQTFKTSILKCTTQNELKELIEKIKDEDAAIVNKAIKTWQNNKTHNEITIHL